MYYVYVLQSDKKQWYIGSTNNLRRRYEEHQRGTKPWKLVYYEAYATLDLARHREKLLKHYGSAWRGLKQRISA
ncbi:MAG: GIY-YIG nuclease family protein [Candidatus Liptonbacteria bacterium]|nr:GIY-YIG nuclease family protein [Candidatus Liptonbacteria bacterium]